MLNITGKGSITTCDGVSRRDFLQAGTLSALGLTATPGTRFGFDCSVAVANVSGDRRDRAAHWGGLSEALVVDRPGSARLLPENWGTVVFGK